MGLPKRIERIDELANNLWWSWHPQGRVLFRALDYPLWRMGGHNPVKLLREIEPDRLQAVAKDPTFLSLYDSTISALDADMAVQNGWFVTNYPKVLTGPVAYFSMEFAIHNCLPIYAGGLGILAGDICKEASDLGLPMIGIGFMYPQGYFHQHISADGWQEEIYRQLDFAEAPINPVLSSDGKRALVSIQIDNRFIYIGAWKINVGGTIIYLLDTDVDGNSSQDRQLSARLYVADRELRIKQEIILGIGGVRLLRKIGIEPSIWHANEGHVAFMTLERVREEIEKGVSFTEATRRVQSDTIFTTHTPVPAGHDTFPVQLMDKYFHGYWDSMGINRESFLNLGQLDKNDNHDFNMSILALKMAGHRNAVSQLHGVVSRKMWHSLWPDGSESEVPIIHITNGIHLLSWIAPEMSLLYEKYLGQDIRSRYDDPNIIESITNIPDDELWSVRELLKRKLMSALLERAQKKWTEGVATPQQILTMGAMLNPDVLTIGFIRRFTAYKRPSLIFHDLERIKRIINDNWRPVQIIFAGKSHPADMASKNLLREVYMLALDRAFQGRIAFVEDYDMHMARYLVQGVDVWLNNPRRLNEACGTSGMKAAANGVLHLSVRDGWWHEGYNGSNGWIIGDNSNYPNPDDEDRADAESLYQLLENEIIPLYYERDCGTTPCQWIRMVKQAIGTIGPFFSSRRMLKEYIERMYMPAAKSAEVQDIR